MVPKQVPSMTTSGQGGPGSNDNEGILYILHTSRIEASPSDA